MAGLSRAQRTRLIGTIVRQMKDEHGAIIDVTLKQFDLPTNDLWRGDTTSYVAEAVGDAPDEILEELASSLAGSDGPDAIAAKAEKSTLPAGRVSLFTSHLSDTSELAVDLRSHLKAYAIESFVAARDIEPNAEWRARLAGELRSTEALVALLAPGFHQSSWTDQEVGFAFGRGIPVMTVDLGLKPYGFLEQFQALDGVGKKTGTLAAEIFEILQKHERTKRRVSDAVVTRLEESGSFQEAKKWSELLLRLTHWERPFSERLKAAIKSNSQISEAFGVPQKIKGFIESRP